MKKKAGTSFAKTSLDALPIAIIQLIISKYLTIIEWSKLDIALCTHNEVRQIYLEALRSEAIKLSIEKNKFWKKVLVGGVLYWIVARGIRVESIVSSIIKDDHIVIMIENNLHEIKKLDITESVHKSITGLRAISDGRLRKCEYLGIGGYWGGQMYWFNKLVGSVVSGLDNLHTIDFTENASLNDFGAKALASCNLPKLHSLNLTVCRNMTDAGLKYITDGLPQLKELYISGFCGSSEGLIAIGNLHNLEVLCLQRYENLTEEGLKAIAKLNLKSIDISSTDINDVGVRILVDGLMKSLESLNIEYCDQITDSSVNAISHLLHLHTFSIFFSNRISDTEIESTLGSLQKLKSLHSNARVLIGNYTLPSLTSLNISIDINYEGIKVIAKKFPNLSSLSIGGANYTGMINEFNTEYITDECCTVLSSLCHLKTLEIFNGFHISNNGIATLAKLKLKHLSILLASPQITDVGLKMLIEGSPDLQVLSLGGYCWITDDGLKTIVHGLRHLRKLAIDSDGLTNMAYDILQRSSIPDAEVNFIKGSDLQDDIYDDDDDDTSDIDDDKDDDEDNDDDVDDDYCY